MSATTENILLKWFCLNNLGSASNIPAIALAVAAAGYIEKSHQAIWPPIESLQLRDCMLLLRQVPDRRDMALKALGKLDWRWATLAKHWGKLESALCEELGDDLNGRDTSGRLGTLIQEVLLLGQLQQRHEYIAEGGKYEPNILYDMKSAKLGERILDVRLTLGISREALATSVGVGVLTIRAWETGTFPNHKNRRTLAEVFCKLEKRYLKEDDPAFETKAFYLSLGILAPLERNDRVIEAIRTYTGHKTKEEADAVLTSYKTPFYESDDYDDIAKVYGKLHLAGLTPSVHRMSRI